MYLQLLQGRKNKIAAFGGPAGGGRVGLLRVRWASYLGKVKGYGGNPSSNPLVSTGMAGTEALKYIRNTHL